MLGGFSSFANPMKSTFLSIVALSLVSSSLAVAQSKKIGASMSFFAPGTTTQINDVRVGKSFEVRISAKDLNLIANRNTTFTYTLSVLPKGSKTPISILVIVNFIYKFSNIYSSSYHFPHVSHLKCSTQIDVVVPVS